MDHILHLCLHLTAITFVFAIANVAMGGLHLDRCDGCSKAMGFNESIVHQNTIKIKIYLKKTINNKFYQHLIYF